MTGFFTQMPLTIMPAASTGTLGLVPPISGEEYGATDVLTAADAVKTSDEFVDVSASVVAHEHGFRAPRQLANDPEMMWCAGPRRRRRSQQSSPVVMQAVLREGVTPVDKNKQFNHLEFILAREALRNLEKMRTVYPANLQICFLRSLLNYQICNAECDFQSRIMGVRNSFQNLNDVLFTREVMDAFRVKASRFTEAMAEEARQRLALLIKIAKAGPQGYFLWHLKNAQLRDPVYVLGLSQSTQKALINRGVLTEDGLVSLETLFKWQVSDYNRIRMAHQDVKDEWRAAVGAVKLRFSDEYDASKVEDWDELRTCFLPMQEDFIDESDVVVVTDPVVEEAGDAIVVGKAHKPDVVLDQEDTYPRELQIFLDCFLQELAKKLPEDETEGVYLFTEIEKGLRKILGYQVPTDVKMHALTDLRRRLRGLDKVNRGYLRTVRSHFKFVQKCARRDFSVESYQNERSLFIKHTKPSLQGHWLRQTRLIDFSIKHSAVWQALQKKYILAFTVKTSADLAMQNKAVLESFGLRLSFIDDEGLVAQILSVVAEFDGCEDLNEVLFQVGYLQFPKAYLRDHPLFMEFLALGDKENQLRAFLRSTKMKEQHRLEAIAFLEKTFTRASVFRFFNKIYSLEPKNFGVYIERALDTVHGLMTLMNNEDVSLERRAWVFAYIRKYFDPFYEDFKHDSSGNKHEQDNFGRSLFGTGAVAEFVVIGQMIKEHINRIDLSHVASPGFDPDLVLDDMIVEVKNKSYQRSVQEFRANLQGVGNGDVRSIILDSGWAFSQLKKYVHQTRLTGKRILYKIVIGNEFTRQVRSDQVVSKSDVERMIKMLQNGQNLTDKDVMDSFRDLLRRIDIQVVSLKTLEPQTFYLSNAKTANSVSLWELVDCFGLRDKLGLY